MTTPYLRHWSRTSGPRIVSGLLIGVGILILVVTQFLKPALTKPGFLIGTVLILAGILGLITAEKTPPG